MEDDNKKIEQAELLIFSILFLFVDVVCFLLDWTVIAAFVTPVLQGVVLYFMDKMFSDRGSQAVSKLGRKIGKYALQVLPWLPTLTGTFLIETFMHNHPKLVAVAAKAASFAPGPVGAVAKVAMKSGIIQS